ncbi:MAG: immunoglobulin domain-containing protein [Chlorobi bacterium]|nr:immunoglobulin domain-containing protein [Chlorobiota bacterium]
MNRWCAILAGISIQVWAYSGGASGYTTTGCTCHGGSSTATSLSLSGTTIVNPGSSSTFTLTLQHSALPSAGFNLAIVNTNGQNAGSLGTISGQQTQILNGELTHSSRKNLSNGSVSWQFTWQAPTTPGYYTVRAVGNAVNNNNGTSGDAWNYMQNVTVTVKGITITAPTPSQILCAGGTVTLQWTSYGVSSVIVSLSSDGGNSFTPMGTLNSQDGQNSQSFTLPSTLQPGNLYRIRLTDASDNTISSTTQNLTLAAPTAVTGHPQSVSLCEGATATFSVTATGANLTYQWRRNGTPISGATQATLTLTNVSQAQAGTYDCAVSGACGQPVTSNGATLTISPQTAINAHPQSTTVCQGATVTFTVSATGANLRYQWRKGTQEISGATSASYTISSVTLADTGFYACVVTGDCGTVTSNQAQLQVALPPVITSHPQSQTLCEGANLTLSVTVNRLVANSYQWKKNGIPLSDGGRIQGAVTATLRIATITPDDQGTYTVEITNSICQASVTSNPAQVTVTSKPTITAEPQSRTVARGGTTTLSVTASGPNLQYQWYRNGQPISGATAPSYTIASATDADAGTYYVTVSNECGSVQSRQITVTVTDAPTPVLELSHTSVNFRGVRVGVTDLFRLVLYNRGTAPLQITSATISGAAARLFGTALQLPLTIAPRDSAIADLTFTPDAPGTFSAVLTIASNAGEREIPLSGAGINRALSPESAAIDTIEVNTTRQQAVRVCNQTGASVQVDSIQIVGDDAVAFTIVPGAWQDSLRPLSSRSCTEVPLSFRPTRPGFHQARMLLYCRQLSTPFVEEIALTGVAVQSTSVAEIEQRIRVMPNPATEAVTFDLGAQEATVRIYDTRGTLLHTAFVRGIYRWNLEVGAEKSGASGIYYAVIAFEQGDTVTIPLVVVR